MKILKINPKASSFPRSIFTIVENLDTLEESVKKKFIDFSKTKGPSPYIKLNPSQSIVLFINGFNSSMTESKKTIAFRDYCLKSENRPTFISIENFEHGLSLEEQLFLNGSHIENYLPNIELFHLETFIHDIEETLTNLMETIVLKLENQKSLPLNTNSLDLIIPIMCVGSSMGFWLCLLLCERIKEKGRGIDKGFVNFKFEIESLFGIGAAWNFTKGWHEEYLKNHNTRTDELSVDIQALLVKNSSLYHFRPSNYSSSGVYAIPINFILEANRAYLIDFKDFINKNREIKIGLIHGRNDEDSKIDDILSLLGLNKKDQSDEFTINNLKVLVLPKGDHRLSKPHELTDTLNFFAHLNKN